MAEFRYDDNIKEFVTALNKAGIAIQRAAADTVNHGAALIEAKYKSLVSKDFRLRAPRFTLGAIRIQKSKPVGSGGKMRPLHDINAIIGVQNMSGGRMHYLAKQEEGGTVRGNPKTGGRVPIPLTGARQSGDENKPIAARYRLKATPIVPMRGFENDKLNPRRQYAAMRWLAQHGRIDPKRMYQVGAGIVTILKNRILMLRNAEETTVIIKARPVFHQAVEALTEARMVKLFVISAKRLLGGGK